MRVELDMQTVNALEHAWRVAPELVREELTAAMWEAELLLQREVQELTPVGVTSAGGLKGSILAREPEVLGNSVIGVTGTPVAYAVPVEFGTKPHPVSEAGVTALTDWAMHKLGYTEKEAKKVAYGIAWNIRHHGTPAVGMFHRAFAANQAQVVRMFDAARTRIVARLAGA